MSQGKSAIFPWYVRFGHFSHANKQAKLAGFRAKFKPIEIIIRLQDLKPLDMVASPVVSFTALRLAVSPAFSG
jgi:hypothetical protein